MEIYLYCAGNAYLECANDPSMQTFGHSKRFPRFASRDADIPCFRGHDRQVLAALASDDFKRLDAHYKQRI